MKTTPKTLYIFALKPQGGFYRHQGRGGPGDKPWPEARLRKRGYGRIFAVIGWLRARRFEPRTVLSVPCQILLPVSGFWPLVLTNQRYYVNGYLNRPLITN